MIEFNGEIFENEYELLGFQKAQTDAQRVKKSQMLRKCVPTKADYIEIGTPRYLPRETCAV